MPLLRNGVTEIRRITVRTDKHLAQLHQVADIPILTGFGVSSQEDVERFNALSDGVVSVRRGNKSSPQESRLRLYQTNGNTKNNHQQVRGKAQRKSSLSFTERKS